MCNMDMMFANDTLTHLKTRHPHGILAYPLALYQLGIFWKKNINKFGEQKTPTMLLKILIVVKTNKKEHIKDFNNQFTTF